MKTLFDQGKLDEAHLAQWLAEQKVEQPMLIQALDQMTLQHPMDPIYLPICKVLWDKLGPNVDEYLKFPYKARIIMGIYLGVLEREEDAKKLLSSVPEEWQKRDLTVPMYHVANELVFWRSKSPRLAIWAWKHAAATRGPSEQAFVCQHIARTCRSLGDAEMIRSELIPFAEAALGREGSETGWHNALRELLWAYQHTGQNGSALERGFYWLKIGTQRSVPREQTAEARLYLAEGCIDAGRMADAALLLRDLARELQAGANTSAAKDGLTQRLGDVLARLPAEVAGAVAGAAFVGVRPARLAVNLGMPEKVSRAIDVFGTGTFRVLKADCTVAGVTISVGDVRGGVDGLSQRILVTLRAPAAGDSARQVGTVVMLTNATDHPEIRVPLSLTVTGRPTPEDERAPE